MHRRAAEILLEGGALPEQAATYLLLTLPDNALSAVAPPPLPQATSDRAPHA